MIHMLMTLRSPEIFYLWESCHLSGLVLKLPMSHCLLLMFRFFPGLFLSVSPNPFYIIALLGLGRDRGCEFCPRSGCWHRLGTSRLQRGKQASPWLLAARQGRGGVVTEPAPSPRAAFS